MDGFEFDTAYDRDVEREPAYATRHRPIQLVATGTLRSQFCPGEAALQASTAALLDRCPTCGNPAHASENNDDGVCVECLGAEAIAGGL